MWSVYHGQALKSYKKFCVDFECSKSRFFGGLSSFVKLVRYFHSMLLPQSTKTKFSWKNIILTTNKWPKTKTLVNKIRKINLLKIIFLYFKNTDHTNFKWCPEPLVSSYMNIIKWGWSSNFQFFTSPHV
jgi:hypothetical protein